MRIPLFLSIVFISFLSCKKEYKIIGHDQLNLVVTKNQDHLVFNWSKCSHDKFKSYTIQASNSALPDPAEYKFSSDNLLYGTLERNKLSFTDSTSFSLDKKYFRVYAILDNGVIASNVVMNPDPVIFLDAYPIGLNTRFLNDKINGLLYIINGQFSMSSVTVYDYKKGEILIKEAFVDDNPATFKLGSTSPNTTVLYSLSYNGFSLYDGKTLSSISSSFNITSNTVNNFLANNYLTTLDFSPVNGSKNLRIYDIRTSQIVYDNFYKRDHTLLSANLNPSYFINASYGTNDSIDVYYMNDNDSIHKTIAYAPNMDIKASTPILSTNEYISLGTGRLLDKNFQQIQQFDLGPILVPDPIMDMDLNGKYWMHTYFSSKNGILTDTTNIYEMGNTKSIWAIEKERAVYNFIDSTNLYSVYNGAIDGKAYFYITRHSFK